MLFRSGNLMAEEKKEEIAVIEITEEYMKERIYEIRGQRVILDSDLSEIYGIFSGRNLSSFFPVTYNLFQFLQCKHNYHLSACWQQVPISRKDRILTVQLTKRTVKNSFRYTRFFKREPETSLLPFLIVTIFSTLFSV